MRRDKNIQHDFLNVKWEHMLGFCFEGEIRAHMWKVLEAEVDFMMESVHLKGPVCVVCR